MAETFENVACTVCGCVCDDLRVTVDSARIVGAEGACALAEPWFLADHAGPAQPVLLEGTRTSLEAGVERAAKLLTGAKQPLIFGLSRSSTEGQRAAVSLADQIGALVDTSASLCHGPSIMAIQQVGESTCSLGEVSNRADLVIFWGADPQRSHPRHLERYSAQPRGMFTPSGRADRTLVVIDVERTETAEQADLFLQVEPEQDFEVIWALRTLLAGQELPPVLTCGVSREAIVDLADRMKSCRCGVVFFGLGITQRGLGHLNVEALLRLVAELNDFTRFHAKRLRIPGDVTGADSVLCWQTGYPFAVNLNRGFPRYNPGEYTASEVLARREADVCLLVGSESVQDLPPAALEHLKSIPTITLDYPHVPPGLSATVQFTTAIYGIHRGGTAYRMDEVPLELRPVLTSHLPSDDEVLAAIAQRIRNG